jgi:hypothetical protein
VLHSIALAVVSKWCQESVVYASPVHVQTRAATRIFAAGSMRG